MAGETALDLAKNKDVLNKASDIMGMLFPYAGLRKKAVEMYISEIEKSNMSSDAKILAVLNEKNIKHMKNQKKIAEIAIDSAKENTNFTSDSGVSEEWLERFMDSARSVSSEDVQLIWGKILSNEFENPGTTPPNMIRILSEMTPVYAKAFKLLCSMRILVVRMSEDDKIISASWRNTVPFGGNEDFLRQLGLSFELLNELETLGVIKFDSIAGYIRTGINESNVLIYVNGKTYLTTSHDKGRFPLGNVMLTSAGEALEKITELEMIDGYDAAIKKYMMSNNVIFADRTNYSIQVNDDTVKINKINY